ncbi:peptidoglycan DD-metalloendopeptidase family protein [Rhizobiaceae bacterium BDR2-2]|uniref:Peptidoglycan DD-metalloendopeptidase family protein n=1 Tax=Ectorhizobium quercum TaxID=2965071 RepID=A0AAE3N095_9HYPH|nr:peptidoglycan DD-metalloendopeptidase family protein [Ectorhizobium quercum]MCX8997572.1 peptidoglycan DD-metalloendopeptidase family protein [Ectorhizobium quercum]
MRKKSVPNIAKSVVRFAGAALLASAATGCSSDVSRFAGGGLFSKTDNLTTASIPARGQEINGSVPVPRADVANGGYAGGGYAAAGPAAPTYPVESAPVYNNGVASSSARSASRPVAVERASLEPPADPATRSQTMAQPLPPQVPAAADPMPTGTVRQRLSNGWSTENAPSVTLRQGESIAALSNRYGVPEKEILAANGLSSGSAARPGQTILIPTFSTNVNAARAAASTGDLPVNDNRPQLPDQPGQKAAVIPNAPQLRDKSQATTTAATSKATPGAGKPQGDAYVVKQGDTLTKIARATNTSVADLKAANGITDGHIRIGQALKLPSGANAQAAADNVRTASVPQAATAAGAAPADTRSQQAAARPQPAETASTPSPYKPPVATQSVEDVEKKSEVTAAAPAGTGIERYRWPVNGAVVTRFGDNVAGKRSDGIAISVPEGTPVKAAENGVVIYAGNGLKELGNTVLIRHDDGKVTVYGNASTLNVQRGQKVQRGQTIAASGMSGNATRPQLHFEVRKDASPVNPSTFLE